MYRHISILVLSLAGTLAGCGPSPTPPHTLVVDPVPVARSLGRDELMQRRLNSALEQLNAQLQNHSTGLAEQVEKEREKLGKKPSDEDLVKFRELVAAASQSIKQTELLARQKAADYRNVLLDEFNDELRTVAMDIARTRGATSVLVVGPDVLWFDPSADITADVIAELRARPGRQTSESPTGTDSAGRDEIDKLEAVMESIERERAGRP